MVFERVMEAEDRLGQQKRNAIETQVMWWGFHIVTFDWENSLGWTEDLESAILNVSPLMPRIISHLSFAASERGSRAYLARGNNTWFTVQMFCKRFCANILVNVGQNVLVNVEASSSCCGAGNGFFSVIGIALCFSAVTLPLQELFLPGLLLYHQDTHVRIISRG